jgi:hypothetical protein
MAQPFLELLRQVHTLHQKHAPDEIEFRFFNEDSQLFRRETIERELFSSDVDFKFELNPNRQGEFQNNMTLFTMLAGMPQIQQNPQGMRALAKQVYESAGKHNFDEIWPAELNTAQDAASLGGQQLGQQPAQQPQQNDVNNFLNPIRPQFIEEDESVEVLR